MGTSEKTDTANAKLEVAIENGKRMQNDNSNKTKRNKNSRNQKLTLVDLNVDDA